MALSDKRIEELRKCTFSTDNPFCPVDRKSMWKAAKAIEAEVRKQDEALIRELVDALEPFAYEKPAREAIATARARLEDKP